mmetsp:Transcript_30758/g.80496  ORF Transcript_30758/g.80496 Transcript_30758/m.80496 type:complete len:412 (-) Transcript_30758:6089-7324(-)
MSLATLKAICHGCRDNVCSIEELIPYFLDSYQKCMKEMKDRAPGQQCIDSLKWYTKGSRDPIPFSPQAGGCGASMRTAYLGLVYEKNTAAILALETSRLTHPHPTGYLGGWCNAMFTSYLLDGLPVSKWPEHMLDHDLPLAYAHMGEHFPEDVKKARKSRELFDFEKTWKAYLSWTHRHVSTSLQQFARRPDLDQLYQKFAFSNWAGSSGHDAVILAYHAFCNVEAHLESKRILTLNQAWEDLMYLSAFHGGDSDTTSSIAAFWFGIQHGQEALPPLQCKRWNLRFGSAFACGRPRPSFNFKSLSTVLRLHDQCLLSGSIVFPKKKDTTVYSHTAGLSSDVLSFSLGGGLKGFQNDSRECGERRVCMHAITSLSSPLLSSLLSLFKMRSPTHVVSEKGSFAANCAIECGTS